MDILYIYVYPVALLSHMCELNQLSNVWTDCQRSYN